MNPLFKSLTVAVLMALLFTACVQPLYLPADFKQTATAFEVKGKQGWMINQRMSFAEFQTGKVKRGWTSTYSIPFLIAFEGGKEKIAFTITNQEGAVAEVMALSKIKSQELKLFSDFFSIPLKYENTFAGTIFSPADTVGWWNFALLNPDEGWGKERQTIGFALNNTGQKLDIKPVNQLETKKGPSPRSPENYGFEFWLEGRMVGAVSVVRDGMVWLSNDIAPNQRLLLAALASSIMLRNNLTEEVANQNVSN
jgi:predicted small lipoprotein YifL